MTAEAHGSYLPPPPYQQRTGYIMSMRSDASVPAANKTTVIARRGGVVAALVAVATWAAPAWAQSNCGVAAATSSVSVATWDNSSGWRPLTSDPAQRASVQGVQVNVTAGGGGSNRLVVLQNWSLPALVSAPLPAGTSTIALPATTGQATLQFYVEHQGGAPLNASLTLCGSGGPQPPQPPTTDTIAIPSLSFQPQGDVSLPSAKKAAVPTLAERSEDFGTWPRDGLSANCVALHDRYWVKAPDGLAYHTWHPSQDTHVNANGSTEACAFGHEHGSNPSKSPAFRFSGGWPAFGHVAALQKSTPGLDAHREEDHTGHKVNVATFRAAFGKPQDVGTVLNDAGFSCHFLSKIHQGSWSGDALVNHLHEYFLTVVCNDKFEPDATRATTWFSVKRMAIFGNPNEIIKICPNYQAQSSAGMLNFDGTVLPAATAVTPTSSGNREFQCFNTYLKDRTPESLEQPELWTGQSTIETGTGTLFFAPYYVVKNPARLYDAGHRIKHTIDYCYGTDNKRLPYTYCAGAPATRVAWNDPASPFKGTKRAVNFKEIQIYNQGGNSEVCTTVFGQFIHRASAATPCVAAKGEVYQAVSPTHNEWLTNRRCFGGRCGEIHGSLPPAVNGTYTAPGIGFEHLETHDDPTVHAPN